MSEGEGWGRAAKRGLCTLVASALALHFALSAAFAASDAELAPYAYEDTRQLVALVEDAADRIAKEGEKAFADFAVPGSRWFSGDIYLFVYALDGTCVFHAASPRLVGRNLIGMHDLNGKPVIEYITDIGRQPEPDAHGWVFYLWEDGTQLSPEWKSAYVRKVTAPDGKVYVVGSGLYNIKMERVFVEERVARAVELLQTAGIEAAFTAFADPASRFNFLHTYVFVLDDSGHTLVDPAFPDMAGRDLSGFRDAFGLKAVAEVLKKLAESDEAWVQYLWPKPGESVPTRKVIYARKVKIGDRVLIVGSDYFLATPIWMKVEDEWPSDLPG